MPELLKVLTFAETDLAILRPDAGGAYASDVDEFRLSAIDVTTAAPYDSAADHSIEILICTSGAAIVENVRDGEVFLLREGVVHRTLQSLLMDRAAERGE